MQLVLVFVFLVAPCLSRKPNPEGENKQVVINYFLAWNFLMIFFVVFCYKLETSRMAKILSCSACNLSFSLLRFPTFPRQSQI